MSYFSISNTELFLNKSFSESVSISSYSKDYRAIFENLPVAKTFENEFKKNNIVVIDKNVAQIYRKDITSKIPADDIFIIDPIEENKTIDTALELITFLNQKNFHKKNNIIVIGGGITQDIGSFVGACFKRGIDWTFIPTTLLAQCDSCIGSKSGLNYDGVKNQIGLFAPPKKILINPIFLKTLKDDEIKSGLGEILKVYSMAGNDLFEFYSKRVTKGSVQKFSSWQELICMSLSVKKAIIEHDELEKDIRRALNYGHTVGHAIETLTQYSIPHGQAVALGMYVSNSLNNTLSKELEEETLSLVSNKNPLRNIDYNLMKDVLMRDKKSVGEDIMMVFVDPEKGHSRLEYVNVHHLVSQIKNVIEKML